VRITCNALFKIFLFNIKITLNIVQLITIS
jgi:hypothetical protein